MHRPLRRWAAWQESICGENMNENENESSKQQTMRMNYFSSDRLDDSENPDCGSAARDN